MIAAAASGTTVRLGHLLAPAGVRYIAFVDRAPPRPKSGSAWSRPRTPHQLPEIAAASSTSRSRASTTPASCTTTTAWMPTRAVVPPTDTAVLFGGADPQAAATRSDAHGVAGVPAAAGKTGAIGPGTLLWSEAANSDWSSTAAGRRLTRSKAFGWTNAFTLDARAPVHVHYHGSVLVSLVRVAEIVLWLAVAAVWFVTRARRRSAADIAAEAETPEVPVTV